jgi:hypothetical protein
MNGSTRTSKAFLRRTKGLWLQLVAMLRLFVSPLGAARCSCMQTATGGFNVCACWRHWLYYHSRCTLALCVLTAPSKSELPSSL